MKGKTEFAAQNNMLWTHFQEHMFIQGQGNRKVEKTTLGGT